jgi:hypothetical protein
MYCISPPLLSSPVVAGFSIPSIPRDGRRGGAFIISLPPVVRKNYGHGIFGGTTIRCQSAVTLRLPFKECLQVGKLWCVRRC